MAAAAVRTTSAGASRATGTSRQEGADEQHQREGEAGQGLEYGDRARGHGPDHDRDGGRARGRAAVAQPPAGAEGASVVIDRAASRRAARLRSGPRPPSRTAATRAAWRSSECGSAAARHASGLGGSSIRARIAPATAPGSSGSSALPAPGSGTTSRAPPTLVTTARAAAGQPLEGGDAERLDAADEGHHVAGGDPGADLARGGPPARVTASATPRRRAPASTAAASGPSPRRCASGRRPRTRAKACSRPSRICAR